VILMACCCTYYVHVADTGQHFCINRREAIACSERPLPIIPDPMMELMKLKLAIVSVLRCLSGVSSSSARWCRSLLDESGVSGRCWNKTERTLPRLSIRWGEQFRCNNVCANRVHSAGENKQTNNEIQIMKSKKTVNDSK